MCGVVGWYNRDGRPVDAVALERIMDIPALQRCRVHIIGTAVR